MEIPELIVLLDLKMKARQAEIAEKKRKVEMEEYDYNTHKIAIQKIIEPKEHNATFK